jgi:hypothetical protein
MLVRAGTSDPAEAAETQGRLRDSGVQAGGPWKLVLLDRNASY